MTAVSKLLIHMDEELGDVRKYAECAITSKEKDPSLSETFAMLAREELNHFTRLNEQLSRVAQSVPANSEEIFAYMRTKLLNDFANAKVLVDSCK